MQIPWHQFLQSTLDSEPNVGRLLDLCEENYSRLQRLLPEMRELRGRYRSSPDGQAALYLEVLEHARYTSLIHLTHFFDGESQCEPDPDVTLRVYHDAREVEVIDLRQSQLSVESLYDVPGLANKWQANVFLAKWLKFCLQHGHRFQADASVGNSVAFRPDKTVKELG